MSTHVFDTSLRLTVFSVSLSFYRCLRQCKAWNFLRSGGSTCYPTPGIISENKFCSFIVAFIGSPLGRGMVLILDGVLEGGAHV